VYQFKDLTTLHRLGHEFKVAGRDDPVGTRNRRKGNRGTSPRIRANPARFLPAVELRSPTDQDISGPGGVGAPRGLAPKTTPSMCEKSYSPKYSGE
jgi:hypothetical protein